MTESTQKPLISKVDTYNRMSSYESYGSSIRSATKLLLMDELPSTSIFTFKPTKRLVDSIVENKDGGKNKRNSGVNKHLKYDGHRGLYALLFSAIGEKSCHEEQTTIKSLELKKELCQNSELQNNSATNNADFINETKKWKKTIKLPPIKQVDLEKEESSYSQTRDLEMDDRYELMAGKRLRNGDYFQGIVKEMREVFPKESRDAHKIRAKIPSNITSLVKKFGAIKASHRRPIDFEAWDNKNVTPLLLCQISALNLMISEEFNISLSIKEFITYYERTGMRSDKFIKDISELSPDFLEYLQDILSYSN